MPTGAVPMACGGCGGAVSSAVFASDHGSYGACTDPGAWACAGGASGAGFGGGGFGSKFPAVTADAGREAGGDCGPGIIGAALTGKLPPCEGGGPYPQ